MIRKLGFASILLALMMFSSGCGLLAIGDWNFISYNGTWEQEYDFSGKEVTLEGFNGTITADVWNEATVKVTAKWSAKVENYHFTPAIELDSDRLSIAGLRTDRDLAGINYVVSVPKGVNLILKTSNGRVSVFGEALDSLNISTSNGSTMVDIPGTGRLTIETSNALVRISQWTGNIKCTTSNGAITAILKQVVDGDYTFTTSNGGISVSTDPDSKYELQANTSNGSVRTSHAGDWNPKPSGTSYFGKYNGGGALITARTSNGNIQLLPVN